MLISNPSVLKISKPSIEEDTNQVTPTTASQMKSTHLFSSFKQFTHQLTNQSTSAETFCLKLSIENLTPAAESNILLDESCELFLNLFMSKDNSDNYFLCENATFPVIKLTGSMRSNSIIGSDHVDSSATSFSQKNHIEKCALFCDISEKVRLLNA